MNSKLSNLFIPTGGITGAILNTFPNLHSLVSTMVCAALGAIIAYFIKMLLDCIFLKKAVR